MKQTLALALFMFVAVASFAQSFEVTENTNKEETIKNATVKEQEPIFDAVAERKKEEIKVKCDNRCVNHPNKPVCKRACTASEEELLKREEALIADDYVDDPTGVSNYAIPKEHEEEVKAWPNGYIEPQPTGKFAEFPEE